MSQKRGRDGQTETRVYRLRLDTYPFDYERDTGRLEAAAAGSANQPVALPARKRLRNV